MNFLYSITVQINFHEHYIHQAQKEGVMMMKKLNLICLCDPMDRGACTMLPCPWDFLGKNTGVGCHFLLQPLY